MHPLQRTARGMAPHPVADGQENTTMLTSTLIIFAIAAIGGLVLASHVLRDKFAPWALSVIHALLGAIGLILLIVMMAQGSTATQVIAGFILLLVAALGGFTLASFHLRKRLRSEENTSELQSLMRISYAFF